MTGCCAAIRGMGGFRIGFAASGHRLGTPLDLKGALPRQRHKRKLTAVVLLRSRSGGLPGRSVDKWGEPTIRSGTVGPGRHHGGDRERTVQMREEHRARITGYARFPTQRGVQCGRVDGQRREIAAAGEQPIRGKVDLPWRGKVDKAGQCQRLRPDLARPLCVLPFQGPAEVDQHVGVQWLRMHTPQRARAHRYSANVRHDTSIRGGNTAARRSV